MFSNEITTNYKICKCNILFLFSNEITTNYKICTAHDFVSGEEDKENNYITRTTVSYGKIS